MPKKKKLVEEKFYLESMTSETMYMWKYVWYS